MRSLAFIAVWSWVFYANFLSAADVLTSLSELPQRWNEIKTGGESACARGGEYSFFVFPGKVDQVVVDFYGGGVCWNAETCSPGSASFVDSLEGLREDIKKNRLRGIYEKKDTRNPIKDWHHILIPYCTGDLHWGSKDKTYTKEDGSNFVVKHRGAVNTRAVFSWIQEHIHTPKRVFVTGCSAGGFGAIFWVPHIRAMFPSTPLVHLSDSSSNTITEDFFPTVNPLWNFTASLPEWLPTMNPIEVDVRKFHMASLYKTLGDQYPDIRFSQYTSVNDSVQRSYIQQLGGDPIRWSENFQYTMHTLAYLHKNYNFFVASGEDHCILPFDRLYSTAKAGQSFHGWLGDLISGQSVENVP